MTNDTKPQTVCGDLHHLPPALAPLIARPHWLLWRWEKAKDGDKWTKVPYQPDGRKAKTNDPKTWNSYDTVMRAVAKFDGIGFCLGDEIAAFDIDDCRDPDTGVIHPWATNLVEKVGSYTEITVSGTGLRIIGLGDGPEVHRKQPVTDGVTLEAYRRTKRYIVITGNPLPGSNGIADIDAHLDATVAELDAKKAGAEQTKPGSPDGGQHTRQAVDVDALPVFDRIKNLIRGIDDPEHQYPSRSERVMAVLVAMVGAGCTDDQIAGVMLDRKLPIGDHIREHPRMVNYIMRQIEKARTVVTPGQRVEIKIKAQVEDILKSAADLQHKTFEELRWIVPKYVPEGSALMAGRPKIGKSWLGLDAGVAVSSGGTCLGQQCEQGDVLALMLEDSDRRLQRRLTRMLGAQKDKWPESLTYATAWPRLNEGGLDWMRRWIDKASKPRLIIIDILERIRQRAKQNDKQSQYSADYAALVTLQELSTEAQLSVLALTHQRKLGAEDLIDTVSGTLGLGGAVDSIIILGNDTQSGKFLYGRGRDLEEFNVSIKQDENCRWQVTGPKPEGQVSPERGQIIAILARVGRPMSTKEISEAVGGKHVNVKNLLFKLCAAGEIERHGWGFYKLPDPQKKLKLDDGDIPF